MKRTLGLCCHAQVSELLKCPQSQNSTLSFLPGIALLRGLTKVNASLCLTEGCMRSMFWRRVKQRRFTGHIAHTDAPTGRRRNAKWLLLWLIVSPPNLYGAASRTLALTLTVLSFHTVLTNSGCRLSEVTFFCIFPKYIQRQRDASHCFFTCILKDKFHPFLKLDTLSQPDTASSCLKDQADEGCAPPWNFTCSLQRL